MGSFISQIKYDGISGKIEFDNAGVRSNITADILELGENGLEKIGTWMNGCIPAKRLKIQRQPAIPIQIEPNDNSLRNKTLRIITALVIKYCPIVHSWTIE